MTVKNRIRCWNPYSDRRRERPCEAWQPIPLTPRDEVLNPASPVLGAMRADTNVGRKMRGGL